jgi:hypothetical protein
MLKDQDLHDIAKCRYEEAKILLASNKPDGAVYLCGYAMELILKRHIVKILQWDGYPETNAEFSNYKSFKVHNLDDLLKLAGLEKKIRSDTIAFARWQIVKIWNSEIRYKKVGSMSNSDAQDIINATRDTINSIHNLRVTVV